MTVNPLPMLKELALKALAAFKVDLGKHIGMRNPDFKDQATISDLYGIHYQIKFAPVGSSLFDIKPPAEDAAI